MEKVVLEAVRREVVGKQVKALRRQGKLPAVMYGSGIDATPITLDLHETSRLMHNLSSSALINISLDGNLYPTLVREKQRNYLRGNFIHLDFLVVSMTEKLRTSVAVELVGESPAVEQFSALLVQNVNELEVECLPQDLPEVLTVDVSSLKEIGDSILVRDMPVPENVEILAEPETAIVIAAAQELPEEEEEEEEIVEEEMEPEVVERGRREEEEEE